MNPNAMLISGLFRCIQFGFFRIFLALAVFVCGASTAFAQAGFAPGCGPFALGAPNIANFPNNNQIPANFAIPSFGFSVPSQNVGCAAYTGYRLAASSQAMPTGVTFAGSGAITPAVFFSGTPTVPGESRNLVFEVTVNGTDWAPTLRVTLDVAACLSWRGGGNARFQAAYSPSATQVSRGLVPVPVAGVAYDTTVTLLPDRYPAAAYCTIPAWDLQYAGQGTPSGLIATSVAGTALSLRIAGTPTQSGAPVGCDDVDGGNDMGIVASAGIAPTSLFFCFTGEAPPALALVGSPPGGRVNSPYAFTFTTNPASGATFSFVSGALPPGLALSGGGTLAGTPTLGGTYNFNVRADGGAAGLASGAFSVTILPDTTPIPTVATNVPTLSGWMLIVLALVCTALAWRRLSNR